jgi:hypothetical protein
MKFWAPATRPVVPGRIDTRLFYFNYSVSLAIVIAIRFEGEKLG